MVICRCVGHYIPQLAIALLDYNAHSTGFKFNIKGVAVRKMSILIDISEFLHNQSSSLWYIYIYIYKFFQNIFFGIMLLLYNPSILFTFFLWLDWESTSKTWSGCSSNLRILLVPWNDFWWSWPYHHEQMWFWWLCLRKSSQSDRHL